VLGGPCGRLRAVGRAWLRSAGSWLQFGDAKACGCGLNEERLRECAGDDDKPLSGCFGRRNGLERRHVVGWSGSAARYGSAEKELDLLRMAEHGGTFLISRVGDRELFMSFRF
jgi:hypothetical protein